MEAILPKLMLAVQSRSGRPTGGHDHGMTVLLATNFAEDLAKSAKPLLNGKPDLGIAGAVSALTQEMSTRVQRVIVERHLHKLLPQPTHPEQ